MNESVVANLFMQDYMEWIKARGKTVEPLDKNMYPDKNLINWIQTAIVNVSNHSNANLIYEEYASNLFNIEKNELHKIITENVMMLLYRRVGMMYAILNNKYMTRLEFARNISIRKGYEKSEEFSYGAIPSEYEEVLIYNMDNRETAQTDVFKNFIMKTKERRKFYKKQIDNKKSNYNGTINKLFLETYWYVIAPDEQIGRSLDLRRGKITEKSVDEVVEFYNFLDTQEYEDEKNKCGNKFLQFYLIDEIFNLNTVGAILGLIPDISKKSYKAERYKIAKTLYPISGYCFSSLHLKIIQSFIKESMSIDDKLTELTFYYFEDLIEEIYEFVMGILLQYLNTEQYKTNFINGLYDNLFNKYDFKVYDMWKFVREKCSSNKDIKEILKVVKCLKENHIEPKHTIAAPKRIKWL